MGWDLIFRVVFLHTPETSHGSIHRFHGWTVLGFCLQMCALTSSLRSSFASFPPVGGVMAIIIHFLGDIDGSGGSTAWAYLRNTYRLEKIISFTVPSLSLALQSRDRSRWSRPSHGELIFFELHCKQVRTLLCMKWIRRMDSFSEVASCKARYRNTQRFSTWIAMRRLVAAPLLTLPQHRISAEGITCLGTMPSPLSGWSPMADMRVLWFATSTWKENHHVICTCSGKCGYGFVLCSSVLFLLPEPVKTKTSRVKVPNSTQGIVASVLALQKGGNNKRWTSSCGQNNLCFRCQICNVLLL